VTVVSWVHHPAVTRFLCEHEDVPVRNALWAHVSGNYFPAISPDFLRLFRQCAFASPYSLSLEAIAGMGGAYARERFCVVYGLGDLAPFAAARPRPHGKFVVGYVGTLNFCKLHPRFLDFCEAAAGEDTVFTLLGDPAPSDALRREAERRGLLPYIRFAGYSGDIPYELSGMDAFGYPLNPRHYGSTENALLEALAAGVPAVALNQCVERGIIRDGVTGFLADGAASYGEAIGTIRREGCRDIAAAARRDVLDRYGIRENRLRMKAMLERCAGYDKRPPRYRSFFGDTPADWFLSAVGEGKECFLAGEIPCEGHIFLEPTKGSPRHYAAYFPQDERLRAWAERAEFGGQMGR
jgi:glycosyltransferase involved in cell wall biosynthesis